MYKILEKTPLNPTVTKMVIEAPLVAKKAEPGQFIIFRASEDGERVPLTIADYDRKAGTVTIIFQIVGGATMELNALNAGDSLVDFVGPLGTPSKLEGLKKVAVVGGGVGCAIAYPTAKKLHELGAEVHSVVGFRNKDLVILEKEFETVSAQVVKMSDDGSWGEKGLVTNALEALVNAGNQYDEVIAIGPLVMMKFVCQLTKKYGIKTTVSMNPIMIDGTGMCGGRRGTIRTYCNILIVFLVSGFWHGAGWTFLVWGALHGLAQVVERVWGRGRDRLPFVLRWGLTFLFVNIAWVFFRAPDCAGALELLGRAVTGGFAKPAAWLLEGLFAEETSAVQMLIPAFTPWKNILRVVLLYGAGMVAVLWPRNTIRRMEDFRPTLWRGAAPLVLTLWCVLSFTGVTTFIYSNF